MSVVTFTAAPVQSSDALFRVWGKALSDSLQAAGGIVKTADTGQIDWATVTRPTGTGMVMGFEIYRFDDALQATCPVFVKIEYMGATAAVAYPALFISVGPGTDGAGALTGMVSARTEIWTLATSSTAQDSRVATDTNRLQFALFHGLANTLLFFGIERTHDTAGNDTNEGVMILWDCGQATRTRQQYYSFGGGAGAQETATWGVLLPSQGTGTTGTAVAVYPVFLTKGVFLNPCRDVLLAFGANVTPGTQIQFTYYGGTKKFIPLDNSKNWPACARATSSTVTILCRDE